MYKVNLLHNSVSIHIIITTLQVICYNNKALCFTRSMSFVYIVVIIIDNDYLQT